MNIRTLGDTRTLSSGWQLVIADALGLILGYLAFILNPIYLLVVVVGFAILLIVIKRPEIAFLGIIIFLSSILPDTSIPMINVGPGRLYITEPIAIGLLVLILLRWIIKGQTLDRSPLNLPISCFYLWAIISTTFAVLIRHNITISMAIPEVRIISYYMLFFLVTNLIKTSSQVKLLLEGLFFLGTVVAIGMIVQYVMGTSFNFISGRVEPLTTYGQQYTGVTRITDTVGEGLITIAFILKSVIILSSEWKWRRIIGFIQWILFGVAVILTYNRTHWAISGLAVLITFILVTGKDRFRIFKLIVIASLLIPVVLFLVLSSPDSNIAKFVYSSFDRFSTIFKTESYQDTEVSTLRWRDFEYKYGFPQIADNPILGLGLGARYRPLTTYDHMNWDGRDYTHNSHLWFAMKIGLVGYLFFAWFSFLFLWRGFKNWRKIINPDMRSIYLGATLAYLGIIIGSIAHPIGMTLYWTPLIGMILGLNEAILKFNSSENLLSE